MEATGIERTLCGEYIPVAAYYLFKSGNEYSISIISPSTKRKMVKMQLLR